MKLCNVNRHGSFPSHKGVSGISPPSSCNRQKSIPRWANYPKSCIRIYILGRLWLKLIMAVSGWSKTLETTSLWEWWRMLNWLRNLQNMSRNMSDLRCYDSVFPTVFRNLGRWILHNWVSRINTETLYRGTRAAAPCFEIIIISMHGACNDLRKDVYSSAQNSTTLPAEIFAHK